MCLLESPVFPRPLLDLATLEGWAAELPPQLPPISLTWDDYLAAELAVVGAHCKPASLQGVCWLRDRGNWPELTSKATASVLTDLLTRDRRKTEFITAVTEGAPSGEDHRC